ncbi:MAG: TetR/AcrR family transcriptional regulator [Deltaproteobacteria bacterium]|nr:TetR/AcrR family transcriptional regulator [Deltaproteobacteria bacterium]
MKREQIKKIAVKMVETDGLINLSRSDLCKRAEIPDGSFPHIMGCNFSDFVEELKGENISEKSHDVNKSRVDPVLRRAHILNTAVDMAKIDGYQRITRDGLAKKAGVSSGLVTRYFNTMSQLRRSIVRNAVQHEVLEIIAQAVLSNDPHVSKASTELKKRALASIAV